MASTSTPELDERLAAELGVHAGTDEEFVERAFVSLVRRSPDPEARDRLLERLGDGSLSRATVLHELASSDEFTRVRRLDEAVAIGLAMRARGEPVSGFEAPAGTDERVVEIPWVLSRLRAEGLVLDIGYAFAEPAYLGALVRTGVELVGADLATREVGFRTVQADVRQLPFRDGAFDQILLVSTLEHVGADNTVYGLRAESDASSRVWALAELRRVLRSDGELLVTVPLGEASDHGWFRQEDEPGWKDLFAQAGFVVEESEAYELQPDAWHANASFEAEGVRYGERGPGASAVLCAVLRPPSSTGTEAEPG